MEFERLINWFAGEVDIAQDEIIGYSIFPGPGEDAWSVEVSDGRERVSAIVSIDANGEFSHGNPSWR